MSYGVDILSKAYACEHDVTQYAVVGAGNADYTIDMPATAGEMPVGVAMEDAKAGHDVLVRQLGIVPCVASAAISRFTKVSIADADGKIRTAVSGDNILGFALASAAEDGDIIPVFLTLNSDYDAVDDGGITTAKLDDEAVTVAKLAAAVAALMQGTPAFTVGTEDTNVINVAIQLKDAAGTAIAAKHSVNVWLSDAAGGAECAVAPSGTVVIGTDGVIIKSFTAKLNHQIVSSAAGKIDLDITEADVKTLYVNVEYQGKVYSSGAVTFAGS